MKTLVKTLALLMVVNLSIAQNPAPTVKTNKISENLYELYIYVNPNNSANIYAYEGSDGILLIDAGYTNTTSLIQGELAKITNKPIRYIINTHSDGDHTGGNAVLGKGATIIAHRFCRTESEKDARFPREGLPNLTFNDSLTIHFNNEVVLLKYMPGHTNTDIVVYFKNQNIAFLGDLVFSDSFPLVHGIGNIYNLEKSIRLLSSMFPEDARLLVGHGRELKPKDLVPYLDMVVQTKNLVIQAIKDGISPDQAKKEDILKDWKSWNSKLFLIVNTDRWIDNVYASSNEGKEASAYIKLKSIFDQQGIIATLAEFKKIKDSKMYFFNEAEINNWGYALVATKKLNDALEVFKINTEMFPDSWNTFDSLGETYMTMGNKKLAIKNYERSLELNPQNTNAVEQLKQLN